MPVSPPFGPRRPEIGDRSRLPGPAHAGSTPAVEAGGSFRARLHSVGFILVALALCGCGVRGAPAHPAPPPPTPLPRSAGPASWAVREKPASFVLVADSVGEDPGVAALVVPFRERLERIMGEVLGEAAVPMSKGWPEGPLGNFAADALLQAARRRVAEEVDMALANNGGLRVPLPAGTITMGKMYELMPFENTVTLLTLRGDQVAELAQTIARRGGEPVAGLSFRIEEEEGQRVAREILVGGDPVAAGRLYKLATSNFLAEGGDGFEVLTRALERKDLPLLVRDAFIEFVREVGVLRFGVEGRIRGQVRR